ncbi:PREDICTED: protein Bop [Dipodomys ordii]|uniref:Protein Bop n=1 Tax=Dipodomys ordii TaxID=10020 RepID=A0A1S3GGA5_DIPOR|nr:PREDICTED: protein Bop [Dipodomys ordii]
MPRGRRPRQGPRNPIRAAANYANAHPWQQMDQASPGVEYTPLVDPWIERPCCGDPVCVRMTMEQNNTASASAGGKPTERGPLAGRMPGPWPLRMDFHWVPGSDPGTFDGSPWLLDRFLAQLGDYMSFRFEHYQDHLSRVCEILGRLTGRARAWAAPYLNGDLPLPDNYEFFCQDLEEVIQDPVNFAEYHAAVPCPLPPASSQPPVAPQLPLVRQYLARFSETLALNMGTAPRPVPAEAAGTNTTSGNAQPVRQLPKESAPVSQEPPTQASSVCGPDSDSVGPAASHTEEAAPKPVPKPSEAQKLDVASLGDSEPQKAEEEISETKGDQRVSLGTSQEVADVPESPKEPPVVHLKSLASEHDPDRCNSAPCDEVTCMTDQPQDPMGQSGAPR